MENSQRTYRQGKDREHHCCSTASIPMYMFDVGRAESLRHSLLHALGIRKILDGVLYAFNQSQVSLDEAGRDHADDALSLSEFGYSFLSSGLRSIFPYLYFLNTCRQSVNTARDGGNKPPSDGLIITSAGR